MSAEPLMVKMSREDVVSALADVFPSMRLDEVDALLQRLNLPRLISGLYVGKPRVASTRAALDTIQQFDHEHLRDAGPSPFQGRTTRRSEHDNREYNLMMSHYQEKN